MPLLRTDSDAAVRWLHNDGAIIGRLTANRGLHYFFRALANGNHQVGVLTLQDWRQSAPFHQCLLYVLLSSLVRERRSHRGTGVGIDKHQNSAGPQNVSREQNLFLVVGDCQWTKYEKQQEQNANANQHCSLHAANTPEHCRPLRSRWIVASGPKKVGLEAGVAVLVGPEG